MTSTSTDPLRFDPGRIYRTLAEHHVVYLVDGGLAAQAYGATRPTTDFDCLAEPGPANLDRLSAAMRALHARLRVQGLDDNEAKQLPVTVDADTLRSMEISTWRTDAGDFDVLTDLPGLGGDRLRYNDLVERSVPVDVVGIRARVAALDDIIASKVWANRPKDHEALVELEALAEQLERGIDL